jgi:hypothetical protein
MKDETILRKQAIEMYLQGITINKIQILYIIALIRNIANTCNIFLNLIFGFLTLVEMINSLFLTLLPYLLNWQLKIIVNSV